MNYWIEVTTKHGRMLGSEGTVPCDGRWNSDSAINFGFVHCYSLFKIKPHIIGFNLMRGSKPSDLRKVSEHKLYLTRTCDSLGRYCYKLITDSQDINSILEDIGRGEEGITGLLVSYKNDEIDEVWATYYGEPWKLTSKYDRII